MAFIWLLLFVNMAGLLRASTYKAIIFGTPATEDPNDKKPNGAKGDGKGGWGFAFLEEETPDGPRYRWASSMPTVEPRYHGNEQHV